MAESDADAGPESDPEGVAAVGKLADGLGDGVGARSQPATATKPATTPATMPTDTAYRPVTDGAGREPRASRERGRMA